MRCTETECKTERLSLSRLLTRFLLWRAGRLGCRLRNLFVGYVLGTHDFLKLPAEESLLGW